MTVPTRRRLLLALTSALTLGVAGLAGVPGPVAAAPVVVEGVRLDDRIQLGGSSILLNGTGVRAVAWFKGYVAALYLPERARTAAEAAAQTGPRRLRMVMLWNAPATEFVKAFEKGLVRNSSEAEVAAMRERMDRFERLVADLQQVRRDDIVDLDYLPASGTHLVVNGKPRGEPIPGADFYAALLRAFVGEKPYDRKMRDGLLGLGAS